MDNVSQELTNSLEQLKLADTVPVGQPHKDVLHEIVGTVLKLLPVVLALFHHATGTVHMLQGQTSVPEPEKESSVE
jgi:hypothetical protein